MTLFSLWVFNSKTKGGSCCSRLLKLEIKIGKNYGRIKVFIVEYHKRMKYIG
jgi:hypothetical protein